jgi:hypothetical protein
MSGRQTANASAEPAPSPRPRPASPPSQTAARARPPPPPAGRPRAGAGPAATAPAPEAGTAPAEPTKIAAAKPAADPPAAAQKRTTRSRAPADKPAETKATTRRERAAREGKRSQVPVVIKSDPEGTRVTTGKHVFGNTPVTVKLRPGKFVRVHVHEGRLHDAGAQVPRRQREPQALRVTLKKIPEPPHKAAPPRRRPWCEGRRRCRRRRASSRGSRSRAKRGCGGVYWRNFQAAALA